VKFLLRQLQYLLGSEAELAQGPALFEGPRLLALGTAAEAGADQGTVIVEAEPQWLLAPVLVDPHSYLEDPYLGTAETLASLAAECAAAGYGSVALLPRARLWRDSPESFNLSWPEPLQLLLWGSLSLGGAGEALAPQADQLAAGAVGLSDGDCMPMLALLEHSLLLGEAGAAPLLVAPRDPALSQGGFVREGVEALRLGWPSDPLVSETLPLHSLLALGERASNLRLMNLSTAAAVELLSTSQLSTGLGVSVSWWHLLRHSAELEPLAEGWHVVPSLGGARDRRALRQGLRSGLITAVAVLHTPLDGEEQLLPLDQRRPGVAGYQLVLPALWQALVEVEGWGAAELWAALSWGPSSFLGLPPEQLQAGSRRWVLFDPTAPFELQQGTKAANLPLPENSLRGGVLATGLQQPERWRWDPGSVVNQRC
jgi:dihydroorotase